MQQVTKAFNKTYGHKKHKYSNDDILNASGPWAMGAILQVDHLKHAKAGSGQGVGHECLSALLHKVCHTVRARLLTSVETRLPTSVETAVRVMPAYLCAPVSKTAARTFFRRSEAAYVYTHLCHDCTACAR